VWTEWKRTRTTNNLPSAEARSNEQELSVCEGAGRPKVRQLRLLAERKEGQLKKIARAEDELWRYVDRSRGESYLIFGKKLVESKIEEVGTMLTGKGYKLRKVEKDHRMLNHLPGCLALHSKKFLFRNLRSYY
jgi:hypothetical protein